MIECCHCLREIDPNAPGNFSKHLGWTTGNSQNNIELRSPAIEFSCGACIDILEFERKKSRTPKPRESPQTCQFCPDSFEEGDSYYVYRTAWAIKRVGGGNNRVALPSEPLGYAHVPCVKRQSGARGSTPLQSESLF